ncbi:hypothetical protein A3K80_05115 [Candidatus Bathyarchaeota archaeon RBG_13_38_9]|nr:MAG: hypothetical protein A3K80_05115 [Candidatus Bathyarchaeota archaeon RBG_13_38_9]
MVYITDCKITLGPDGTYMVKTKVCNVANPIIVKDWSGQLTAAATETLNGLLQQIVYQLEYTNMKVKSV